MHCGSVQIDCCRCLRAKVSSLTVEIQCGDVVFTANAREHCAVLNPFGRVVPHTLIVVLVPRGTMQHYGGPPKVIFGSPGTATGEADLSPWLSLRHRTRHGEEQYVTREDQYGATTSSHS